MDIKSLINNPAFQLVSFGVTVASLVLACIFYLKARRLREPSWAMRTITLIEGYSTQIEDLEVKFRGKDVKNLSISRIAFWNQGAETINGADMPAGSPLAITAKEAHLLDVRILQQNCLSCNFSIQPIDDGTSCRLAMDYCDRGQGVVLQVIHTGTGAANIELSGVVKGSRSLNKREPLPSRPQPLGAGILLGGAMIAVAYMKPNGPADPFMTALGALLLLAVTFVSGKQWLNRLPGGLETFDEVSFGLQSAANLRHKP